MGKIALEGLEFFAYHGYYPEERKIGNKYGVSIEVETNFTKAAQQDRLQFTVNYEKLYELIRTEMSVSSQLLEHLAQRIIDKTFEVFPFVKAVRVEVSKFNPPIGGVCRVAKVTLESLAPQQD